MAKAKTKVQHRCSACGETCVKWQGRCPSCDEWNTLQEETALSVEVGKHSIGNSVGPISITEACSEASQHPDRLLCGMDEFDRVLGGGFVAGSLVLLGGSPGVGKSTLLLQVLQGICQAIAESTVGSIVGSSAIRKANKTPKVLYASGEESSNQTAIRGSRLGVNSSNLFLLAETRLEEILKQAKNIRPSLLAIDSIQTVFSDKVSSVPGSMSQVRECTAMLMQFAKTTQTPTVIVGHVTKDGGLAGPKTLEHLVDTVLQLEGEAGSSFRVLRSSKNRFGSTQELGVFEMNSHGLACVPNPSEIFLAERPKGVSGSVVVASAEGKRPFMVELQALVAPASAGLGRRTAAGVDRNRVSLLLAVLAQKIGLPVLDQDVFVNVAGGMKLTEPAADLAIALAMVSSAHNVPLGNDTVVFGEVGLAGEVRAVSSVETRLSEAEKLGFRRCILPKYNADRLERNKNPEDIAIELVAVSNLSEAIEKMV